MDPFLETNTSGKKPTLVVRGGSPTERERPQGIQRSPDVILQEKRLSVPDKEEVLKKKTFAEVAAPNLAPAPATANLDELTGDSYTDRQAGRSDNPDDCRDDVTSDLPLHSPSFRQAQAYFKRARDMCSPGSYDGACNAATNSVELSLKTYIQVEKGELKASDKIHDFDTLIRSLPSDCHEEAKKIVRPLEGYCYTTRFTDDKLGGKAPCDVGSFTEDNAMEACCAAEKMMGLVLLQLGYSAAKFRQLDDVRGDAPIPHARRGRPSLPPQPQQDQQPHIVMFTELKRSCKYCARVERVQRKCRTKCQTCNIFLHANHRNCFAKHHNVAVQ